MRKLIRNKKGVDSFTFLLTIFAIVVLIFILVGLTMKYNKLNNTIGGAGSSASYILSAYDSADRALLYLDNAVGMSMWGAVYDLAYNGFYPAGGGECGSSGTYSLWSKGSVEPTACEEVNKVDECVPDGYKDVFEGYFSDKLNRQINAYNEGSGVKLIENNYELELGKPDELNDVFRGRTPGLFQVIGKAKKPIVVDNSKVHYEVMPSFRENGDVDLIGDFGKVTPKAPGLVGQDSGTMDGSMKSYTEETGLEWNVDNYNRNCGKDCDTGEACEICNEVCEDVPVDCSDDEPDCSGTETVCSTVCDPGVMMQYYCETTAGIGVKIPDEKYDKKKGDGYRAFVTGESANPEVKEYNYRFGLNWVKLQDEPVCVRI